MLSGQEERDSIFQTIRGGKGGPGGPGGSGHAMSHGGNGGNGEGPKFYYNITAGRVTMPVDVRDASSAAALMYQRRQMEENHEIEVIQRDDLRLIHEISSGPDYFLHAGRNEGRAVVVKVFNPGPSHMVRHRLELTAEVSKRFMHSNLLRVDRISSPASLSHFIVYQGVYWKSAEGSLAAVLKTDLWSCIRLGFKLITGISAGMNYLHGQGVFRQSIEVDNFDIFLDADDQPMICFDPPEPQEVLTQDPEDNAWTVLNAVCENIFMSANSLLYQQPSNVATEILDVVRPTCNVAVTESTAASGAIQEMELSTLLQRKFGWHTIERGEQSLVVVAQQNQLELKTNLSPIYRRTHSDERNPHRCPGYVREEIRFTTTTRDSVVVVHDTPSPLEICFICHETANPDEAFRCICGDLDRGSRHTIKCGKCGLWSHADCVGNPKEFTCQPCCHPKESFREQARNVDLKRIKLIRTFGSSSEYFVPTGEKDGHTVVVRVRNRTTIVRKRLELTLELLKRLMHPNVLQIMKTSSPQSPFHFIVYEDVYWKNAEGPLSFALRTNLQRSISLGFRMIAGISAGMSYLSVQGLGLRLEWFDIFVDIDDRFVIRVNPLSPFEGSNTVEFQEREDTWVVFNELCRRTLGSANRVLHRMECQMCNLWSQTEYTWNPNDFTSQLGIPSDDTWAGFNAVSQRSTDPFRHKQEIIRAPEVLGVVPFGSISDNLLAPSALSFNLNANRQTIQHEEVPFAVPPRREYVWWTLDRGQQSLATVARRIALELEANLYLPSIHRLTQTDLRSGHRCPGYIREEIRLATTMVNSAVVVHDTPCPLEICPICHEVVGLDEVLRCVCGDTAPGSNHTIKCQKCNLWSHSECVGNPKKEFTCGLCIGPESNPATTVSVACESSLQDIEGCMTVALTPTPNLNPHRTPPATALPLTPEALTPPMQGEMPDFASSPSIFFQFLFYFILVLNLCLLFGSYGVYLVY
ncbi:hypothetical protein B0H11DRAFT_2076654 [Mycena galericulata]|nr:hypothetical protein B0H11DRAFT_2076654 [Mycena galericulata]